jgi:lysophospholipase L1-like esterase
VGATRPDETGYVARLYQALSQPGAVPHATALRNLAVGGETSTSMIRDGQLVEAVDAIARADPPIALVTLDIGGNDLLRLLGTDVCAADPLGSDCLQLLALTLADFEANYRQILGELMTALDESAPVARLAVMTYFNPFSGTDASHEAAGEVALLGVDGRVDCDADDPDARGMNDIIACVGEALGAVPVDIEPAFAGLGLELTHIASEDIHANDRGYEVIADAFLAALEREPR